MKVLLTSDVGRLGWLGDVVEVADGFARNYLLPQGLARAATEVNIRAIAEVKASRAEQRCFERARLEKAAERTGGAEAVIAAAANEQGHLFGAVHARDIAANLRAQGFEVRDEYVCLAENIKEVGTYEVGLEFAAHGEEPAGSLTATVSVVVVPEGADVEAFKAAEQEAREQSKKQGQEVGQDSVQAGEAEGEVEDEKRGEGEGGK